MLISNGARSLLQSVPDSFCAHCSRNSPRLLCSLVSYADLSWLQQLSIMYRIWLERPSNLQWAEQDSYWRWASTWTTPDSLCVSLSYFLWCFQKRKCFYRQGYSDQEWGFTSEGQKDLKTKRMWRVRFCFLYFLMLIGCILHLCVSVCVCVSVWHQEHRTDCADSDCKS